MKQELPAPAPWINSRHPPTYPSDSDLLNVPIEEVWALQDEVDTLQTTILVLTSVLLGIILIVLVMYNGGLIIH
jgi:hypothetical protein|nr:MAG TPA: hypothetical protein [Caudoviricetes sp.]